MDRFSSGLSAVLLSAMGTVAAAGSTATLTSASTCRVESPPHRVAVVELYTSQGCSSCPPADRWLSGLHQRYPPTEAIALSLHVGYWDYIGWKDPFAQRAFNDRQRQWATANQSRSVYTPGVFIQGREVRDWSAEHSVARQVKRTNAMPAGASLSVAGRLAGQQLQVEVTARTASANPGAELRVALVQSGLSTAVHAGENRGERLGNDHVVREWSAALPLGRHTLSYKLPEGPSPDGWALVAFVQQAGQGTVPGAGPTLQSAEILQAVRWTPLACKA